jgi:putative phosphoribosyl transferase
MPGLSDAEIEIPVEQGAVQADLAVPDGAGAIVVFAHGSGSSRHSPRNRWVAERLRLDGLGTLLLDLLTDVEETADLRTGRFRFDIDLLAGRLIAAVAWLGEQPDLANLGLGYFGASTGAAAALVAAARQGEHVGAVVSRGGRPDLAGAALPMVRAPTLLIVGGLDETVLGLNHQALAQMRCERYLEVVPGATHLFPEPGALDHVAALAGRWFVGHLVDVPSHPRSTKR